MVVKTQGVDTGCILYQAFDVLSLLLLYLLLRGPISCGQCATQVHLCCVHWYSVVYGCV